MPVDRSDMPDAITAQLGETLVAWQAVESTPSNSTWDFSTIAIAPIQRHQPYIIQSYILTPNSEPLMPSLNFG